MVFSGLVAALLVSAAVAKPVQPPVHKATITKKIHVNKLKDFVARDRARAQYIAQRHSGVQARQSVDVTSETISYLASVDVGSPATTYNLIVDTGSSNTWVGADKRYKQTSTSKSTGKRVTVTYGSGTFSGTEFTDQVAISDDLVIDSQSIGVASRASGFPEGVDGILGIGPVDLTQQTVSGVRTVPTVTDNLLSQGIISREVVSVSFEPSTEEEEVIGELTFGGTDSSKFIGDITFVPITRTSPANQYWGIDQTVSYGTTTLLKSAGIVDTGTTLVYLATDIFQKYQSATGATLDSNGLLRVTSSQAANLKPLNFLIGGQTFTLSANAQLWPRKLNDVIDGSSGAIYLVVNDLKSKSGKGLDFINGQAFLERFYTVYDTTGGRVGFAPTPFTNATTN